MRKILIVGAGQSGLVLANGLRDRDYDVTIMTGRTSNETRTRRPALTQFTLNGALEVERHLGLDFWSIQAPPLKGIRMPMYVPGQPTITIEGRFPNGYGAAVDSRVKMADWLEHFEDKKHGNVTIHGVTTDFLDYVTNPNRPGGPMYDLVVVATGSGELGELFSPDRSRFGGAHPRVATQVFVDGLRPSGSDEGIFDVVSAPQGRICIMPILTADGPAHSILILDSPGGALDGSHLKNNAAHNNINAGHVAEWVRASVSKTFPDMAERLAGISAVDARAAVVERIMPQVRHPVAHLPSGGAVVGLADVVKTEDPIGGQGWNNSTKCALTFVREIIARGESPFDEEWMRATYAKFYERDGMASAILASMMHGLYDQELPAYFGEIIGGALTHPEVADRYVHGVDDPSDYFIPGPDFAGWFGDADIARAYLSHVAEKNRS